MGLSLHRSGVYQFEGDSRELLCPVTYSPTCRYRYYTINPLFLLWPRSFCVAMAPSQVP